MELNKTYSGVDSIGDIPWGSHFCTFYNSQADLVELMVAFFKAGLENNEQCVWVVSAPLTVEVACEALQKYFPEAAAHLANGNMSVFPYSEIYLDGGAFNPDLVLKKWLVLVDSAVQSGYSGLRVNGNEDCVTNDLWDDFMHYEKLLTNAIFKQRVVILCSYPLNHYRGREILDITHAHRCTITKDDNEWHAIKISDLQPSNSGKLENRVMIRTKELETAVMKLKQEVQARAKSESELKKAAEDLLQRNVDLQQFTYIVSHNLRGPITNIIGISNILEDSESESEQQEMREYLHTSISQLDEIVKDLNLILQSKFAFTEKMERVCFNDIINAIVSSINDIAATEKVEFVTDFSAIDSMLTFRAYVYSIFYNLISNSIKYKAADKKAVIRISSAIRENVILVNYQDNGIGIDMDRHGSEIFGLYKRFSNHVEGKGIGLYMVKTQVEALGGTIAVESRPSEGATFKMEFPLH